jgi:hypothetical protein
MTQKRQEKYYGSLLIDLNFVCIICLLKSTKLYYSPQSFLFVIPLGIPSTVCYK